MDNICLDSPNVFLMPYSEFTSIFLRTLTPINMANDSFTCFTIYYEIITKIDLDIKIHE